MWRKCLTRLPNFACDGAAKKPRLLLVRRRSQQSCVGPQRTIRNAQIAAVISPGRAESGELAADLQKLLPPLRADGVAVEVTQALERARDGVAGRRDHGCSVAVSATDRLLDDLV